MSKKATAKQVRSASLSARAGLAAIGFYQKRISPLLPDSCIYSPTCSEYAKIAIKRYGLTKGSWLAAKRIARCNPFREGGYDPVP